MNHWLCTEEEIMMNKFFALLTATMVVLLLASSASAATRVFLMGGQSNMAGVGGYSGYIAPNTYPWSMPPYDHADAPCPSSYDTPSPTVKFWNYTPNPVGGDLVNAPGVGNGWTALQIGFGYRSDQFGPELSFGARLQQLYPTDEICIVKLGITSTSLGNQWNPTSGSVYNLFKSRVTAALNNLVGQGKTPIIEGMAWMQGEDDSTVASYAAAYATNLKNFITKVRTTFNAPNMRFVAGRITYMTELWASRPQIDLVRNAQSNIGTQVSNAACFNTDDLEWGYYGHYGTQGQVDLGLRFANQFPGSPAPEPSTLVMVGVGAACLLGRLLRRRKVHGKP
jgi:hypothetical protein